MGQNQWYHFGVGAAPILEPIRVGIGMFTGGAIWILTHGHIALIFQHPAKAGLWLMFLLKNENNQDEPCCCRHLEDQGGSVQNVVLGFPGSYGVKAGFEDLVECRSGRFAAGSFGFGNTWYTQGANGMWNAPCEAVALKGGGGVSKEITPPELC